MSARSFPAGTDFINCGSAAAIDDLTTGTYLAWVYPTAFTAAQRVVSKGAAIRHFRLDASARVNFLIARATTSLEVVSADTVTANRWAFIGGSFNTAGAGTDQYAYLGSLTSIVAETATYTTRSAGTGATTTEAAENLLIGSSGTGQNFTGRVAWVQLYDRQLSLGEIRMLQFRPLMKLQGCLGSWRPGWDAGVTVPDRSGAGNHGTLSGASTLVAGLPVAFGIGAPARMPYVVSAAVASIERREARRRRILWCLSDEDS